MRHAAGFTLLEVLIALLVLALGLIGGTALQLHAMRTRHESVLLSSATRLAAAMADRVRANVTQVPAYLNVDYDANTEPVPAAPPSVCVGTPCDADQLALLDIYELKRQIRATFPAGRARICRDAHAWAQGRLRWACSGGPAAPLVIKIGWRGKRPDGTPDSDTEGGYAPGIAVAVAGTAP